MARYIDADALTEELKLLEMFITGMRCGKTQLTEALAEYKKSTLRLIDEQPTADVVPKQAYLEYEETTGLKKAKQEVAREIFGEIEKLFFKNGVFIHTRSYNELKKKYTEGE